METITLGQLKKDISKKKRIPLKGSMELTFRCNLRCVFCYCHTPPKLKRNQELSCSEMYRIIEEITEAGCLNLLITGGEPLVRKDFKKIYSYAKIKGLLITLYSNGTLIDEEMADFLLDKPPQKIEITLYGMTREVYEKVTQVRGSYDLCRRGIKLLLDRNLPLEFKTTVCTLNHHEVGKIRGFAEGHGLQYRFDTMLDPMIDGDSTPCQYRLTPEEIVALDSKDPDRSINLKRLLDRKSQIPDSSLVYICGAGESAFHIDPFGKLSMCLLTRYASYDLKKGTFKEGFYEFFSDLRSQRIADSEASMCAKCDLIDLCTNCPGTSYLDTGSLGSVSNFHCEVARLRAKSSTKGGLYDSRHGA